MSQCSSQNEHQSARDQPCRQALHSPDSLLEVQSPRVIDNPVRVVCNARNAFFITLYFVLRRESKPGHRGVRGHVLGYSKSPETSARIRVGDRAIRSRGPRRLAKESPDPHNPVERF